MADLDRQAYPKLIASRRAVHRMRMPASIAPRGFGMIRPSSVRFVLKLTQQVSRRVGDKGPVLQPGPLCWRPPQRWRVPEQMGRGWQTDRAGPSGAACRRRRRPLSNSTQGH